MGADAWNSFNQATYFDAINIGTTSRAKVELNNYNDVFFRNASSGNAIATTYTWYIGGDIVESDIAFWDRTWRFFTGTSGCSAGFYVEDIMTHEMGHFYGLGHTTVSGATMYPTASYCDQTVRSLEQDDINGIEALYGEPGAGDPPPNAPTLSQPTVVIDDPSVDLSWTDVDGETRYVVERGLSATSFLYQGQTNPDDVTYTDTTVNYDTTYYYRVFAENSGGLSPASNIVQVDVGADPTPDPPSDGTINLLVTPKTKGRIRVQLYWSNAPGSQVDIYRDANPGDDPLITTSNDGSYTDRDVSSGNTYYYQVCDAGSVTYCSGSVPAILP